MNEQRTMTNGIFAALTALLLAPLATFAFGTEALAATVHTLDGDGPSPAGGGGNFWRGGLRASAGSYAHKGMHMAWMEKVRKRAQKPVKTGPKT